MGILDRIFGSSDPIKTKVEETVEEDKAETTVDDDVIYDKDSDDWPPHNILYGKEKWPYEMDPVGSNMLAGRELETKTADGKTFMGKKIRDMIENRRHKPEAPTRIGYTKDNVKGVQDIYIDHEALFKHLVLFGRTGYGKSTLMKNIMLQWINAGYGICYIDPKGEDSYDLVQQLPPHRLDDLVWVEPNADREKQVGFNVFDTSAEPSDPNYQDQVESLTQDFVDILEDTSQNWGPQIDNITTTLVKNMVRSEDPYNPLDMVKIVNDEEEREIFANQVEDDIQKVFVERLAELNRSSFEPIVRRIRKWVESDSARQIMAHDRSKIDLTEAVLDGKIIVLNTDSIQDSDITELVIRMTIARVWSTIRSRTEEEKEDFFLCIDEFDKVINDSFNINSIISLARSKRLSVFVANQQPSQLNKEVKQSLAQVQSMMSFNPGNDHRDQQAVAQTLGDVETWKLNNLDKYRVVSKPYMNDSQQSPVVINTYNEYPPLRTREEAEQLIKRSLDKYGAIPEISSDIDDYGAKRFVDSSSQGYEINVSGDKVDEDQVLECVYAASLRNETEEIDGKEDWVTLSQIKQEVDKYAEGIQEAHDAKLSSILEGFTSRELEKTIGGGNAYFRLGNEGLKKAFEPDTGMGASGGKSAHRVLLRKGHKSLTKLGYDVKLPSQDEAGSLPDGVAEPPIKPVEESDNFDEAVQKELELVEKYPRLAQLFGDDEVSLEAESTTITRPSQTIKNLKKAYEQDKHCVFAVKDGTENKDKFEYWARVGEDILKNPPFVSSMDKEGNRKFYKTNKRVELSNKGTALVPKDVGRSYWVESGYDTIKLVSSSSETLAELDSPVDLRTNPRPSNFPFHYVRNTKTQETLVKDENGNIVDRYENLSDLQSDGKYKPVYMPIIPDIDFTNGEYPDEDDWTFIIIPQSNERGPVIYEDGQMEPLLPEDGAKIDVSEFDNMNVDVDLESAIPDELIKDEIEEIKKSVGSEIQIEDGPKIEQDSTAPEEGFDPLKSTDNSDEKESNQNEDGEPNQVSVKHKFPDER